ncbi:hypothetical protein [Streptomyces sp. Ncost-T10-10d]|uniref:hypothetical protein n=1 Tax=Streptomyces sp. Ncost-T10-10d TaxID=1839774 RepID=UPI00081EC6B5|nr:hypothetical protein [Streptomyces sp. Ncost-T10-10d]SCF70999.1 hypothetical protein GA0115254_112476 [Streptomyces sp. Ncost-T10-10d]
MRSGSNRARVGLLASFTALAAFASMGSATAATTLNGNWAPFNRCPVDAPAMLAADGATDTATCVSSHSASGSIKLGNTVVPVGASDLQIGVVTHPGGGATVVSPQGGALIADSAQIPGGLLGLMCPSDIPVITGICNQLTDNSLNRVTATIESVNNPSGFQLLAGTTTGKPIITLPVRIHLENPFLGNSCYIGSASDPILLRPENLTRPTVSTQKFAGDGTTDATGPMGRISLVGATQNDTTYAVPAAGGCGLGLLNWAVNLKTGLPSASGNNNVVLNNAQTYVATINNPGSVAPDAGKLLSQYWHSAAQ